MAPPRKPQNQSNSEAAKAAAKPKEDPVAANVSKLSNRVAKLEDSLAAIKAALASNLNLVVDPPPE